MSVTQDYIAENVRCDYLSSATPEECESLLGKTIAKVEAREYTLLLTFTDNSTLEVAGHTYGDSALSVDFTAAP